MAENGEISRSKRTRHLNVEYLFVTDKIKKREITFRRMFTPY